MFQRRAKFEIDSPRLHLRLAQTADHAPWQKIRQKSIGFLNQWEPVRAEDYPSKRSFQNRVYWGKRAAKSGSAFPFLLFRAKDRALIGALTLDNIRKGPAQTGTIGYWIGEEYARQGYMREALEAVVGFAFEQLDLSRIEAACLPENVPSRGLLEKSGFKYEGVAQSYLQIAGRWRNHVLYANLRHDRRGKSDAE